MVELSNLVRKFYSQPPTNIDMSEWYPVVGGGIAIYNVFKGKDGIAKEFALYSYKPFIPFVLYQGASYFLAANIANFVLKLF